jgi:hypothetical protein
MRERKLIGFWCMSYFSFDGHWILLDGMQWSNGRRVPFPEDNNPSEVPPEATEEDDDDVAFLLKARTLSLLLFRFFQPLVGKNRNLSSRAPPISFRHDTLTHNKDTRHAHTHLLKILVSCCRFSLP